MVIVKRRISCNALLLHVYRSWSLCAIWWNEYLALSRIPAAQLCRAGLSLRNTSTNEQRVATFTAAGVYQFVSLASGSYELTTTMKGFSTSRTTPTLETILPLAVRPKQSR